jgi:hypothetical protein
MHPTSTREAGTTIIEIQDSIGELKPAKWVKLDTSLVGDNNNKETAPTLFIYIRLLLITPTRAVHVFLSAEVILPLTGCRARRAWCFAEAKRRQTPQRSGAQRGRIVAQESSAADSPKK